MTKTCHSHGDGKCNSENCEYGYEHSHADGDCEYDHGTHNHESGCDYSSCDGHIHNDDCYANCNEESIHQHTDSCLGDCVKPVHTHVTSGNNRCDTVRNGNVLYVITAKYEQTIGDIWPTYDLLAGLDNVKKNDAGDVVGNSDTSKFRGWTIPTADAEAVSKRITMTSDLCDSSGSQNATANYGGTYTYRLYYLFESFDQDADEDGHVRREYTYTRNNKSYTKYFDSDNLYYQELQYSSNTQFGQKDITGMTPVGVQKVTEGNIIYNYLYYERQRYTLSFQNVDTVVESTSDIMYGQPLSGYEYRNDDGGVDPPYPSGLEPNAYVFDGWYTTPECYTGTEFNFATGTMPNNNLTLYANWVPTVHTVTFYFFCFSLSA